MCWQETTFPFMQHLNAGLHSEVWSMKLWCLLTLAVPKASHKLFSAFCLWYDLTAASGALSHGRIRLCVSSLCVIVWDIYINEVKQECLMYWADAQKQYICTHDTCNAEIKKKVELVNIRSAVSCDWGSSIISYQAHQNKHKPPCLSQIFFQSHLSIMED